MGSETVCTKFSERFTIIDNNSLFTISFMMGARAIEMHPCNYWPEFGINMLEDLRDNRFEKVQKGMIDKVMPFYKLWTSIDSEYTNGDGYLDKLCMELIGLPSSRCSPPTRDLRNRYRKGTVEMMKKTGVPGLII